MYKELSAEYIDGIKKLHVELDTACKEAYNTLLNCISLSKDIDFILEMQVFTFFVDFSEPQPKNAIRGYVVFEQCIYRFASIVLDYAVLFPVCEHHSNKEKIKKYNGITYSEICKMIGNKEKVLIILSQMDYSKIKCPLYESEATVCTDSLSFCDDIGKVFEPFHDIKELKVINVPENLLNINYTLVGKQYYAPYSSNKEIYCVLFASLNDEHDENAVKVLRWIPKMRYNSDQERDKIDKKKGGCSHGDIFFELGYISRSENIELHQFMIGNSSRLLFGKVVNDKISLLGGIKIFYENNFKYPACLIKIPIK